MKIIGPCKSIQTFALLDDGSTITLLDSKIAKIVGAQGIPYQVAIKGINNSVCLKTTSKKVSVIIEGQFGKHKLENVNTIENLCLPSQTISKSLLKESSHLQGINIQSYTNAVPYILIGQDNWELLIPHEVKIKDKKSIIATKTLLGWVIHGRYDKEKTRDNSVCLNGTVSAVGIDCNQTESLDSELHEIVKTYFQIDSLGIGTVVKSNCEEMRAIDILDKTTRRVGNCKWETKRNCFTRK